MNTKFGAFNREYAQGFAAGLEHVNDSSIHDIQISIEPDGHYVTFQDDDTNVEPCDECDGTRWPQEEHNDHCSLYSISPSTTA